MKLFHINNDSTRLLIFFAGFYTDNNCFMEFDNKKSDILFVYDYSDLNFDEIAYFDFTPYVEINLIAWPIPSKPCEITFFCEIVNNKRQKKYKLMGLFYSQRSCFLEIIPCFLLFFPYHVCTLFFYFVRLSNILLLFYYIRFFIISQSIFHCSLLKNIVIYSIISVNKER